jgi:hypothetical protein
LAKPVSQLRKTQIMLHQLTVAIVSIFGVISAFTIFSVPVNIETLNGQPNSESNLASLSSSSARSPASAVGVVNESGKQVTVDVLTLDCNDGNTLASQATQIRLRGKVCTQNSELKLSGASIKNGDNKDVATVFLMNRNFTTDVIDLPKEENILTITSQLSNGESESRTLKIIRKPLAQKK